MTSNSDRYCVFCKSNCLFEEVELNDEDSNSIYIIEKCCNCGEEFNGENVCSICHEQFDEPTNNAEPIINGVCCNECYKEYVIPKRLKLISNQTTNENERQTQLDEYIKNETMKARKINYLSDVCIIDSEDKK